jgi:hypothetical protein
MNRQKLHTRLLAIAFGAPFLMTGIALGIEYLSRTDNCDGLLQSDPVACLLLLLPFGSVMVLLWARGTALRWWERGLGAVLSLLVAAPCDWAILLFGAGWSNCLS